jgi:hypothetical protein
MQSSLTTSFKIIPPETKVTISIRVSETVVCNTKRMHIVLPCKIKLLYMRST